MQCISCLLSVDRKLSNKEKYVCLHSVQCTRFYKFHPGAGGGWGGKKRRNQVCDYYFAVIPLVGKL